MPKRDLFDFVLPACIILGILLLILIWQLWQSRETTIVVMNPIIEQNEQVSGESTVEEGESPIAVATEAIKTFFTPRPPEPESSEVLEVIDRVNYKRVMATVFWAGEKESAANDYISNEPSAWDSHWARGFGGYDSPSDRCGYKACGTDPEENTFYFALPYNDLDDKGKRKESAQNIPWFKADAEGTVLKNRWVLIRNENAICYAQWEDVGPNEDDDFDYVFGTAAPKNVFGLKAGIDISPALRDCLGLGGNGMVSWRFVEAEEVPHGPWTERITTTGIDWD